MSASTDPVTDPTAPLQIEVWSDVVCPWCYIGKRRLTAALEQSGIDAQVRYRSFQLDPNTPRPGQPGQSRRPVSEMLAAKMGASPDQVQAMQDRVTQIAAQDGLDYRMEDTLEANTGDAHRLLHLAAERDPTLALQGELKEALLRANFTQGWDIADAAVLTELAVGAGLPAGRVASVLETQEYADAVEADIQTARQYGATGVPFVVIDGRYGVSGAQPVETYVQALRQASA